MANVQRNGLELHFTVRGKGPPVVLGHSFLCSGRMWAGQEAALAERYRVINIDARGHGRSGPANSGFTLYDMVDDVLAVLDHLGLEAAVWAGLSIGGMVGMRAALTAPERVAGLILIDTDAGAETRWNRFQYGVLGRVARTVGIRPLLPRIARQMFGKTTRARQPALVAEWTGQFRGVHVPSALRMLRALRERDDLLARLQDIAVPALVLVGSEDTSLPPPRSRLLAGKLPGAQFVEIAEAGHLSALEQPAAVTTAMRAFLDGL